MDKRTLGSNDDCGFADSRAPKMPHGTVPATDRVRGEPWSTMFDYLALLIEHFNTRDILRRAAACEVSFSAAGQSLGTQTLYPCM